jgi:hypothetical protein
MPRAGRGATAPIGRHDGQLRNDAGNFSARRITFRGIIFPCKLIFLRSNGFSAEPKRWFGRHSQGRLFKGDGRRQQVKATNV